MTKVNEILIALGIIFALVLWQRNYFARKAKDRYDILRNLYSLTEEINEAISGNDSEFDRKTKPQTSNKSRRNYYKILYWTPYYKMVDYGFGNGRDIFTQFCGKDYLCETTMDKKELDSSDVILFHNWHIMDIGMPHKRKPTQVYVFNTMEPPLSDHGFDPRKFHDVFNLTMTYRTDSDIPTSYFNKRKVSDQHIPENLSKILKLKKKAVSWFVSDCHTPSKREDYVKELKKYIDVDIFGKCGIKDVCKKQVRGCMNDVISQYYFYLSFEKIMCQDYITEKVMHPYKYKAIPIVRGLGHYDTLMPNHSYINVDDFESPKDLAKYLHELMANPDQYLSYFQWRNEYYFAQRPRKLCLLCKFMMDNPGFKSVYHNFTEYWWPTNQCELVRFGKNALTNE